MRYSFLVFSVLLCSSTFAHALPEISPYVGIDAAWRHMGFKPGFGKGLFKETIPQGNIYIGAQITDYLALEGGYESTTKKTKTVTLGPGDPVLGTLFPDEPDAFFVFKQRLRGWHISVVGFSPCLLPCDPSIRLFGGVGLSRKKIHLVATILGITGEGALPEDVVDASRRNLIKRKSFLRLSAGVQKLITDCIGVRAIVVWENTRKFGSIKSLENPLGSTTAKLNNTYSAGIGIFIKF